MSRFRYSLIFIFILIFNLLNAQTTPKTTTSARAIKFYEKAISFARAGTPQYAVEYLNKAIQEDSNFAEAYMVLGDLRNEAKDYKSAIYYYNLALQKNQDFYPKLFYMVSSLEMKLGYYEGARQNLTTYLQHPGFDITLRQLVNERIDDCDVAIDLMKNPVPFDPVNLGDNINTRYDEYVNTISTDEKMLIFTVKHPVDKESTYQKKQTEEDFYVSNKGEDSNWLPRRDMGPFFNTNMDEGALVVSPDGKLIVFAANHEDSRGRFDLYFSEKQNDSWSQPKNMGAGVNTEFWESQPSISSDGKTIFFVSDRRGGLGGSDIWKVTRQEDGSFGNPQNMGAPINSTENEMTPFIHFDSRTMYFSSNGHKGMGGMDFFVSRFDGKKWSEPTNIGYPINSIGNEIAMIINPLGNFAYISSDNKSGKGGFDIYMFELYEKMRPTAVNYMKGIVRDARTKQPLLADFELVNLDTKETVIISKSDIINGDFLLCIPSKTNYALTVQKDGYLFYSDNFEILTDFDLNNPFLKNIDLQPIIEGEIVILKNVFFETASYELDPKSFVELDQVVDLLNKNKTLKIEISGHTDNVGDDKSNQVLSQNRANAVYKYLISKGIDASRLTYAGYGEAKPIMSNETSEGRKMNRRTEFKVISK